MLPESLPPCLCKKQDFRSGGANMGPGFSNQFFSCNACKRGISVFWGYGCVTVLLIDRFIMPKEEATEVTRDKIWSDYVNGPLIAAMRTAKEAKEKIPRLPKIPEIFEVFLEVADDKWEQVDHAKSQELEVPPDPIRLHHDEFWKEIVADFGATEIPNQYYRDQQNNEPWFEFKVEDATIRFGPRKRVLSIQVNRPKPFNVEKISEVAKRDNTTYEANGMWQPWGTKEACSIEVHAWTKEKFDEYLSIIIGRLSTPKEASA